MEYGRIKPISGENGYEKTALTMKSIAELLAEEGTNMDELKSSAREPAQGAQTEPTEPTVPSVRSPLQQPVHARGTVQNPTTNKAGSLPLIAPADAPHAPEKPRSFLRRLFGG
ncbi:hypothetical protein [Sulfitobacter geojensis]|uniref:hypothetical protein n=1 Tax=Sulfitobacter geojensis TaxID=1342299 RepID=UPI00249019E0|nr:hypothetical protein [Sulfitobacter geojensis]